MYELCYLEERIMSTFKAGEDCSIEFVLLCDASHGTRNTGYRGFLVMFPFFVFNFMKKSKHSITI